MFSGQSERIRKNSGRGGLLIFAALAFLTVCGCGGERELPADTPWNNGHCAIMETENGYYSNQQYFQCLRYYERGTDTEIFLCAKPECRHDGNDSCVATYRDKMTVNSVLYDGNIYILTVGETDGIAGYTLYRAATDGSFLDKVADVFQAQNSMEAECYYNPATVTGDPAAFVIHKGYAYVPFFLSFDWSLKGFVNGGIMRVDLKTGKTEQIYEMERLTSPYPWNLRGYGDRVYFDFYTNSGYQKTVCYQIGDGSLGSPFGEKERHVRVDAVTEKRIYSWQAADEEGKLGLEAFDAETGEWLGLLFAVDDPAEKIGVIPYRDMLLIGMPEKLAIYSEDGEKLGEMDYKFKSGSWFWQHSAWYDNAGKTYGEEKEVVYTYSPDSAYFSLKISQDKVYAILGNLGERETLGQLYAYAANWPGEVSFVFSCPIEDILQGKGKWTNEYNVKSWRALNPEREAPQDSRQLVKRTITD